MVAALREAAQGRDADYGQAGVYAGVLHYLKAIEALKSDAAGDKVMAKMKEMPTDDPAFGKGRMRQDGRKMHDCTCSRSRNPPNRRGRGTTTRCAAPSPPTRLSGRRRKAGVPWSSNADGDGDMRGCLVKTMGSRSTHHSSPVTRHAFLRRA